MMGRLSEEKILSTFEQLVQDGIVVYEPHEIIEEDCEGYPVSRQHHCVSQSLIA